MIQSSGDSAARRAGRFVGRSRELGLLNDQLRWVRDTGQGSLVIVKGRRRVGKSRLVEEFVAREGLPVAYFLATRQRPGYELARFAQELARSDHPRAAEAAGLGFESWETALAFASAGATAERPIVIVIDEFAYLVAADADGVVESTFNAAWERVVSRRPVLLILVGSDLSLMDMLTEHGRPLYGRPSLTLTVEPLHAGEAAEAIGIGGAEAIEAYHVIGGFPRLLALWRPGFTLRSFLAHALGDEDSPFVATGQRILDAEFPTDLQARTVLSVIGAGERTYGSIARAANVASTNLRRSLELLESRKRVVASEQPLSVRPSRETRYRVADPYLRFHLRFVAPNLADLGRGRERLVIDRIVRDWPAYVGVAVEPFVRDSIERLLPDPKLPGAARVGGYWTRANDPRVDLVGADDAEGSVAFVGSVKWRAGRVFRRDDVAALRRAAIDHTRGGVPGAGADTRLVAVSRSGFAPDLGLARTFGPDDLMRAWEPARG